MIPTGSEEESIALVSDRKADMMVRSLIVAAYTIKKEGLFNLKIAGDIDGYVNKLRIGVLKDEVVLRDILNKGVNTLTPQEREAISNKHVSVTVQKGIDYSLVWKILAGATLLMLLTTYWIRKLNFLNKELERLSVTDKLTGLCNRIKLDKKFEDEILRSMRSGQPFGIILLDVDFFKRVNDTYGHPTGDSVLSEVAAVLRANTRETDMVGRWGGEEFLIICPQTDRQGTIKLAENLRQMLDEHDFPIVKHQTASFGVTIYRTEDQVNTMIARADKALYSAKHNGRNRVEFL